MRVGSTKAEEFCAVHSVYAWITPDGNRLSPGKCKQLAIHVIQSVFSLQSEVNLSVESNGFPPVTN